MIAIQGKDIGKSYGGLRVLNRVTFSINAGDKVGIVGSNGAGKTTLFRCLSGEELLDEGQIMIGSDLKLGVVEQELDFFAEKTLEGELMTAFSHLLELRQEVAQLTKEMEKVASDSDKLGQVMARYQKALQQYEDQGGYAIENRIRQVVAGLGFSQEDLSRPVHKFSGGQQTRVSLGKLLLKQPDILLLDEPTNHLDIAGSEWLESFLKSYPGTVLVISHDRFFLEQVSTKILELEQGKAKLYSGNYTRYRRLKAEQKAAYEKAYEKQQTQIQATEKYIDQYRAGIKSKQARGRQKQLDRLERMEQLETTKTLGAFNFPITETSGERVLELTEVSFGYESNGLLFRHVSGLIRRGEMTALVGPNGCGKTTLLKLITGSLKPCEGELLYGSRISIAYYSQQHEDLNHDNQLLEEIVKTTHLGEKDGRAYLGRFLFSQEEVFKRVGDLSGGEKSRLALLKLFLKGANFLVLDEPTNHLDIPAKEVLEQALVAYEGTAILVSHDRYFLDQVVDKVWEFREDNGVVNGLKEYLGGYSYYRSKKEELHREQMTKATPVGKPKLNTNREEQKKGSAREQCLTAKEAREREKEEKHLKRQKAKELEALEQKITEVEEEKERLAQLLADPDNYTDGEKAKELTEAYKEVEESVTQLYERWETLAAKAE